jgi:hypothetical protein
MNRKMTLALAALAVAGLAGCGSVSATSAATATATGHRAAISPKPTPTAARQTVEFKVTGSQAVVTYGPAGSSVMGTVPLAVTQTLRDPSDYSVQAQLKGSGSVTAEILVNGKVVSRGTASGGYNIATAEISVNPLTGKWVDDDAVFIPAVDASPTPAGIGQLDYPADGPLATITSGPATMTWTGGADLGDEYFLVHTTLHVSAPGEVTIESADVVVTSDGDEVGSLQVAPIMQNQGGEGYSSEPLTVVSGTVSVTFVADQEALSGSASHTVTIESVTYDDGEK